MNKWKPFIEFVKALIKTLFIRKSYEDVMAEYYTRQQWIEKNADKGFIKPMYDI